MNIRSLLANLEIELETCKQENRGLQELNMKQGVLIKEFRAQIEDHGRKWSEEVEALELQKENDTLTSVIKALVKIYGGGQ